MIAQKKETVVFTHHVLSDQNLSDNSWFEGFPNDCLVSNRDEVRKIISKASNVTAVFNGHAHWNKKDTHNGLPYFTIQSMIENEHSGQTPSEAYAIVKTNHNNLNVSIVGNHPVTLS